MLQRCRILRGVVVDVLAEQTGVVEEVVQVNIGVRVPEERILLQRLGSAGHARHGVRHGIVEILLERHHRRVAVDAPLKLDFFAERHHGAGHFGNAGH